MAHQQPITGTGLRTPRAAAAAGIVFSLLFSLALVLLLSAPSDTATEGVWLTDTTGPAPLTQQPPSHRVHPDGFTGKDQTDE
jgi:hypothetical protein